MLFRQKADAKPQADAGQAGGVLRRKCACGTHTVGGGKCDSCGKKRLQRKALNRSDTPEVPAVVNEVLRSPGQALDASTRAFMEQRFAHDFSRVRVHTDTRAAESALAVNALAFTIGHDIVFGAQQYAPDSAHGRRLLAHELTHTLQQSSTASSMMTALRIGPPDDAHEREAEAQAARVVETGEAGSAPARTFSAPPSLQRQPEKGDTSTKAQVVTPTTAQQGPCMTVAATRVFSRGNDDPVECQYETARITVRLLSDPCACSETRTTMPLRVEYRVLMEGKSYQSVQPKVLETQASTFATGIDPEGKKIGGGISLRETGLRGKRSGPLIHKKDGAEGDPGDTLEQALDLRETVPCKGGSAKGRVKVGKSETIRWSIKTSGTEAEEADIKMVEKTQRGRWRTPTVDLAVGEAYPPFPGEPRDPQCTCNAINGLHEGENCPKKYMVGEGQVGSGEK